MTGILDRIDADLAETQATTHAICDQYLADAMRSVRDLLDGAALPRCPPSDSCSRYVPPRRRLGREASGVPRMLGITLDEWAELNLRPVRAVVTEDQAAAFLRGEPVHVTAANFR